MDTLITTLTVAAAVGSALIGGVFLIFSVTIMPALERVPAPQAVAVMQVINRVIVKSLFLPVFLGTALLSVLVAAVAPGTLTIAGAILYVIGSLGVTMAANVPLNNALDRVDAASASQAWARYAGPWTLRNHVRAVASTAGSVVFVLALI
ncbi:DUF1772 domain-containing protein [Pseudonocardia sp. GCM10023141]|uniref:anthrone oxygenase family protein n=1 Tax=Pseudonocardia sp. GCM10023141 TaxID=3252653 RepID=UPI003615A1AD